MAWIATIPPHEASGELAQRYGQIAEARGGVAEIHQVQSLNPRAMATHFDLYRAIVFQDSPLTRAQRESLAVVVSGANSCRYCEAHHGEALAAMQAGDEGPLHPALVEWAERLAKRPEECTAADLERLRACGFDDRAILDAALTIAYFSFVNRLVQGLGVSLEHDFQKTCRPE